MKSKINSQFLTDLESVWGSNKNLYPENFFIELNLLIVELSNQKLKNIDFLNELETIFIKWKTDTVNTNYRLLKDVHVDDPLYSPITLFESMDYGRLETAHTRTLAWLFNKNMNHGFQDILIKKLISEKFNHEIEETLSVESQVAFNKSSQDKKSGRMDILAHGLSKDSKKWALAIEAKINATEREDQLSDYDDWLEDNFQDHYVMKMFLTTDKRKAKTSKDKWEAMSYIELASLFSYIAKNERLSEKNKMSYPFLKYYISGLLSELSGFKLPIDPSNWEKQSNIYELNAYLLGKF